MNKGRRKEIDALIKQAGEAEEKFTEWLGRFTAIRDGWEGVREEIRELAGDIQTIRDDEQEYLDNMPESMKGGEKGSASADAITALDEAYEWLDDLASTDLTDDLPGDLSEATSHLEEAKG